MEALAVLGAGNLVRRSEIGRGDITDYRAGVGMVQQVAYRRADSHMETVGRAGLR